MLRSAIRSQARLFARVSASGISDTDVNTIIDQAQIFIARDINGIPKRSYAQIEAKFFISTDMYFNMTIAGTGDTLAATDIQISATELTGASGTTIATALQAAIRTATGGTGTTVAWTSFYFTITTVGATSQIIAAPAGDTYSDPRSILFGAAEGTQTGTAWTGGFPEDCTLEADLPSDFHSMIQIYWDTIPLSRGIPDIKPQASGNPVQYWISDDKLYFKFSPSTQEMCTIFYNSVPIGGIASDTTASSLPTRYEMMLVYYTTYMMLLTTHEHQLASTYLGLYNREKNKMICNRSNQNPQFADTPAQVTMPFTITTS